MRIKKILDFKKSCVAIACTLTLTVAMGISCFASTSTTFKVNNVSITGKISYTDTNDYNPLAKDSVTAKTSAKASMDSISATATIYYAEGSTIKTVKETANNTNCTSCSVTAKSSSIGIGFRGVGNHGASHNGNSGSGTTGVNW